MALTTQACAWVVSSFRVTTIKTNRRLAMPSFYGFVGFCVVVGFAAYGFNEFYKKNFGSESEAAS